MKYDKAESELIHHSEKLNYKWNNTDIKELIDISLILNKAVER